MPGLAEAKGQDLVTSSGDTLLGADDKAGMAEIMAAVAHLAANPDLPRPAIRVGFTPDEEIGKGPILFDVERFGARCAYTLDGSDLGELQAESFTGSEVVVRIRGVDIHPGHAKGDHGQRRSGWPGEVLAALPGEADAGADGGPGGIPAPRARSAATRWEATLTLIARDFEEDLKSRAHPSWCATPRSGWWGRTRRPAWRSPTPPSTRTCATTWSRSPRWLAHAEEALRREGLEPVKDADPRRYGRLAAEREGPAHAQHLHRRP